jgi:hypothetical protein
VVDEARADVDDVAGALGKHRPDRALGDAEEPGKVHRGGRGKVIARVVSEGLANVHPGVVDQAVDPSEPLERPLYHALGSLGVCDVSWHGEDVGVVGGGDRSRGGHNRVATTAERGHEAGADASLGPCDDRDWLRRCTHATR